MPVEVHIMGAQSLNILYARDISHSGLGVRVPHGLRDSDLEHEVELVITLPGVRSFLARGVVRHRDNLNAPNAFGVEFTDLKPEHRGEIRRFIRRLQHIGAHQSDGDS
jgi:c-di-GMP-binding flagellar brake protein YcgR